MSSDRQLHCDATGSPPGPRRLTEVRSTPEYIGLQPSGACFSQQLTMKSFTLSAGTPSCVTRLPPPRSSDMPVWSAPASGAVPVVGSLVPVPVPVLESVPPLAEL